MTNLNTYSTDRATIPPRNRSKFDAEYRYFADAIADAVAAGDFALAEMLSARYRERLTILRNVYSTYLVPAYGETFDDFLKRTRTEQLKERLNAEQ